MKKLYEKILLLQTVILSTTPRNEQIMKKTLVTLTVAAACLPMFSSCEKENAEAPSISFQTTEITIAAEGGEQKLSYEITNPVENTEVKAESSADWVEIISAGNGELVFDVSENTGTTERTAEINVTYTPEAKASVTLKQSGMEETGLTFEIEYAIDGNLVDVTITPSLKDRYYIFETMELKDFQTYESEEDFKDTYQEVLDFLITQSWKTPEEYVKNYTLIGDQVLEDKDFKANTEFMGFIFEVSLEGRLVSYAVTKPFTTGSVSMSDNSFEISVTDIEDYSANCTVTTANNDTYIIGWSDAEYWEGKTDNQIRDEIIETGYTRYYYTKNGSCEMNLTNLMPDTDFFIFVFGFSGGVATTDLYREDFRTKASVVSDVTFIAEHDKYFDGDILAEKYPDSFTGAEGKAVLPVSVKGEPADKVGTIKWHCLEGDYSSTSEMDDRELQSYLEMQGRTESALYFYMNYDEVNTIVGVIKDNDGNYSKVYREKIVLTKDGVSPVGEFVPFEPMGVKPAYSVSGRIN